MNDLYDDLLIAAADHARPMYICSLYHTSLEDLLPGMTFKLSNPYVHDVEAAPVD